ncbi:MBOAT family protein [Candidatus Woesearchaeota archaeon]|nr:MBOAT family protein [Candidatus Woesearchaeota archaeon]
MVLFTSFGYILFLAFCVFLFYIVKKEYRALILAATGMIFYAYYAGWYVLLIFAEARAYFLAKYKNRYLFIFSIIISIFLLVYFKYNNLLLGRFNFPKYAIPLGISFFTFEFIHYLVDAYKGKIENPVLKDHLAFVFFFPTMLAGPIKRYQEFVPQILTSVFHWDNILSGILRILIGFFKKIVLADTFAMLTGNLVYHEFILSAEPIDLALRLLAFGFQIYFDFSAYSDVALGSAKLFGIIIPENFNWPYLARNIADFWRRWHISLMSWFRDYLYKPLGGSREGIHITIFNVLIVMHISGLWHGSGLNFLLWGSYHGIFLALYQIYKKIGLPTWPRVISIPLTFLIVNLGWAFFSTRGADGFILIKQIFSIFF